MPNNAETNQCCAEFWKHVEWLRARSEYYDQQSRKDWNVSDCCRATEYADKATQLVAEHLQCCPAYQKGEGVE